MKFIIIFLLISFLCSINGLVLEKIKNSKFSNAELIDNKILVSYNGGISSYSYDFKLINEYNIDGLKLNSYSEIHQIDTNKIIVESSRAIYLIENYEIKYVIDYDSSSYFRQVLVINSNYFLVLKVELTTSIISYCLYSIESNILIKIEKSNQSYNHYTCNLVDFSNNKYIVCFLVNDAEIFYNIFDTNLNYIKEDTKIDTPENILRTNYLYSICITNTKIILMLIKNNDLTGFYYKLYLLVFEFLKDSGTNYLIKKVGPQEDFILYDQIYTGNYIFHIRKLDENSFVVVFPVDDTKKEFLFSIISYNNDVLSIKEEYKNIPLSFQYEIQGLKFLKINTDFAISFYYLNDEEEEEIQEVYLSYLTNKKCSNFEITTTASSHGTIKETDFLKYISFDIIPPEQDIQKVKINNQNTPSISFLYDNNPYDIEQTYEYKKWSFNSGDKTGIFEVPYTIYSSNDYYKATCKIIFKISEHLEMTEEEKIKYEDLLMENEIKDKVEEMKANNQINFENNIIYESEKYKISFYNTSESSQNNQIQKEGVTNVDLLGCEKILKTEYNIPDNEVLKIMKVEISRRDTLSMQVEYEVYSENFQYLDLKHCKDEIIKVTIPYNLNNITNRNIRKLSEEIDLEQKYILGLNFDYDILNPNSPFYNDICTPFDSEYLTDLIIEDRKKYYYQPQLFCEDTCTYSSYNITNKKVDCDCCTKTEPKYNPYYRNFSNNIADSSFNKKISNVNFKVFTCLGKGFNNFYKNIGALIILIIFISFCALTIFAIFNDKYNNNKRAEIGEEIPSDNSSTPSDNKLAIMSYELAIQNDKRKYFQMYFGTIKYNNLILFMLRNKEFNNNIYLRIMIFLFFIILLFLFNLFLFLDKYFTNIYIKEGKYDFGSEFPMSLVSALICLLINMIIRILLKQKKNKMRVFKRINNNSSNDINIVMDVTENKFNIKILFFSLIGVLVIIIIFFYLVSFSGIFINSQKYLLIRVIYSFILSIVIPLIFCLIYTLFRFFGLKMEFELLYKISLIVQNY